MLDFAKRLVADCQDAGGQLLFLPEGVPVDKLIDGKKCNDEATFAVLTQMSSSQPVGQHKIFTYTDTLQAVTAAEEDVALAHVIQGLSMLNECQRMASAAALVEFHDVPSSPLTELKQGIMPVSCMKQIGAAQAAVEAAKAHVATWESGSAKVNVPDQLSKVIARFTWMVESANAFVTSRKALLAELAKPNTAAIQAKRSSHPSQTKPAKPCTETIQAKPEDMQAKQKAIQAQKDTNPQAKLQAKHRSQNNTLQTKLEAKPQTIQKATDSKHINQYTRK